MLLQLFPMPNEMIGPILWRELLAIDQAGRGVEGQRVYRYEFEVLYRNIPRSTEPRDENPSFQPWFNVKHLSALKDYCRQPAVAAELGAGFYVSENEEDE